MEGGRGSSRPPGYSPGIILEDGTGHENDSGSRNLTPADMGMRPITKVRDAFQRPIMTSLGRVIPGMLDIHEFVACEEDDESKLNMSNKPLDTAEEDGSLLNPQPENAPRRFESGEMPIPNAQIANAADSETRLQGMGLRPGEETADDWTDPIEHIRKKLTAIYECGEYPHIIENEEELQEMIALMTEFSNMYREDTLKAHLELVNRLVEEDYLADLLYDEIHRKKNLSFSQFENAMPNDFVKQLVATGRIKSKSLILELGPGGGEDARHIVSNVPRTRVIGIDISQHAVRAATRISRKRGLSRKVIFKHGNYLDLLRSCRGQLIDGVYMHSTGQYRPRRVQEQIVFRRIAEVLQETRGALFLAMKLGASDSAHSLLQIELDINSRDNPKIDLRNNGCYRGYPETEEDVHSLLAPSGLVVEDSQVVPYFGYDRPGETEYFCQLEARPK